MFRKVFAGGILISTLLGGVRLPAQESEPPAEQIAEIVVTATREEKLLKDAPGAVTVITKEEMAGKNTADLAKVLEDKTGLKIVRYGSLGATTNLHIRGLRSQHVLIMMDDRVLNAPSTGDADLSFLSVDNIERIEVVRGPASALYGGNAVAGVVNIITKKASPEPTSSLSTLYGTYGTMITQLSDSVTKGPFGYFFSGNYKTSEGHRDNSTHHSGDTHLKFNYRWTENKDLSIQLGNYQDKTEAAGARPAKDPALRTASQIILGNSRVSTKQDFSEDEKSYFNGVFKTGHLKVRSYLNLWDDNNHREWIWAGKHYTEDANFKTVTYGTELISHFDFSEKRRLTFGVNAESNTFKVSEGEINVTDNITVPSAYDARRGNYAAFVQNEIQLGKMHLTIGGRWDNPTDFESQFSARGNLLWHIGSGTSLQVSAGDSYRAPSLNDLNWPQDDSAEGNPDLLPEKGDAYGIGFKHSFGDNAIAEINLFRQTLDNMIAWAPTGSMGPWGNRWRPSNLNNAWINGAELSNTYAIADNLAFNLNYTFLAAKQRNQELRDSVTNLMESETRKLSYVPSHKLDVGFIIDNLAGLQKLSLDLAAQYVSPTYQYYSVYAAWPATSVTTQSKKLPGYWLANLKLRKKIKNATAFLGVDNLTNKDYAIQFGSSLDDRDYPMPGRSVLGGLEIKF